MVGRCVMVGKCHGRYIMVGVMVARCHGRYIMVGVLWLVGIMVGKCVIVDISW